MTGDVVRDQSKRNVTGEAGSRPPYRQVDQSHEGGVIRPDEQEMTAGVGTLDGHSTIKDKDDRLTAEQGDTTTRAQAQ
jgi:hypothetical protein